MSDNMDMPDELDRTGDQGEIIDRITEEHNRGGHQTGPVAGCSICLKVYAPAPTVAELAAARVHGAYGPPPMDDEIDPEAKDASGPGMDPGPNVGETAVPAGMSPVEYARVLKDRPLETAAKWPVLRAAAAHEEPDLADVALQEAEGALATLRDRGGASTAHVAQVEATVGVVRAMVAINDTLRQLVTLMTSDDERRYSDLHEPPDASAGMRQHIDEIDARRARAERMAREGLPSEPPDDVA